MPYMLVHHKEEGKVCVHKQNADKAAGEMMHCYTGQDAENKAKEYMKTLYAHSNDMSVMNRVLQFLGLHLSSEPEDGERWVTINGQRVLIDEKSGEVKQGNKKAVGWKDPHEEFKFVQRRLAAGNLKRGEKRMLERRSERLAKQVLGVKD